MAQGIEICLEETPRTDSRNQRCIGQVKLRHNRPTRALGGLWGCQGKTPVAFPLVKVLSYVSQPSLALCVPRTNHFAYIWDSGAFGSGLAIFSRYPIVASSVWPFSCKGSPIDVTGGDWIVAKACASVLIDHPVLGEVEVYNTHVCVPFGGRGCMHI